MASNLNFDETRKGVTVKTETDYVTPSALVIGSGDSATDVDTDFPEPLPYAETFLPGAMAALTVQNAKWYTCMGFSCIAEDYDHAVMKFNGLIPAIFPNSRPDLTLEVFEDTKLDLKDALGLYFYIVRRA